VQLSCGATPTISIRKIESTGGRDGSKTTRSLPSFAELFQRSMLMTIWLHECPADRNPGIFRRNYAAEKLAQPSVRSQFDHPSSKEWAIFREFFASGE
jgi:hypothetical protein